MGFYTWMSSYIPQETNKEEFINIEEEVMGHSSHPKKWVSCPVLYDPS
jgi:hypothetical protein